MGAVVLTPACIQRGMASSECGEKTVGLARRLRRPIWIGVILHRITYCMADFENPHRAEQEEALADLIGGQ